MNRKAPPRGLRWCEVPDCPYYALTGSTRCVRHQQQRQDVP